MVATLKPLAALLGILLMAAAEPGEDLAAPYRILQQANRTLDATLATSAYTNDGILIFEVPGQPTEMFRGKDDIHGANVRTFNQVAGNPIDLSFRFDPPGLNSPTHSGAYRARTRIGDREITGYGRFAVQLVKQDGIWRFAEDRGWSASRADFDMLPEGF